MACRNSGIMAYHWVWGYCRPQKWIQKGQISLKRHNKRLKSQNLRFLEFWNRFSGNSGISGVLKSSLSDFPRLITYNYDLTFLWCSWLYTYKNRQKLRKIFRFSKPKMSTFSSNISTTTTNFVKGLRWPGDIQVLYRFHPDRLAGVSPRPYRHGWKKNTTALGLKPSCTPRVGVN